jgi:Bacterial membrane protein YfhO
VAVAASLARGLARRWPEQSLAEAALVTALFAVLLCAVYAPVVFRDETFAPSTLAGQTGKPGAEYPYGDAEKGPFLDAGSYAWIFEPMARVVHDVYADGEAPLWNPYTNLGVPLLGDLQSAPLSPFYAPVFLKPTQNAWDLVFLLRVLVGGVGCFVLLRALGARPAAAFVPAVGYLLSPAYALRMLSLSLSVEALAPWLLLAILVLVRRPGFLPFAGTAMLTAAAIVGGQPEVLVVLAWLAAAWGLYWWWREGRSRRVLLELAGAGAAGALVAAPQLLLGAEYVSLAVDLHLGALGQNRLPVETLKLILLGDYESAGHESLGIVMLSLAAAGIAGWRKAGMPQGFMLAAAAVWAVRALGVPAGEQVVGLLPGVSDINIARYGMFVYLLAGAISAAAGVQAIVRGSRPALAAGTLTGLVVPLALWPTGGRAEGNVGPALAFAAAVALGVLLVHRLPPLAPVLAAVFVAQLLVLVPQNYARAYNPYLPQAFVRDVRERLHAGDRVMGVRSVMHPQISAGFGLADPRNGLALETKRFDRYLYDLVGAAQANFNGYLRADDASSPYLAALGVRYLLAPRAARLGAGLTRVFPEQAGRRTPVAVWEVGGAYPRAWIPAAIRASSGMEESERLLREGGGDMRAVSVVEDPTAEMLSARGAGEATTMRVGWNEAVFRVRTNGAAVLVLSDQYFPGWTATVDGEATEIRPANLTMRAVAVPAGEHEVVFSYEPAGWRFGLVLTALGALVLAARGFAPWLVARIRA